MAPFIAAQGTRVNCSVPIRAHLCSPLVSLFQPLTRALRAQLNPTGFLAGEDNAHGRPTRPTAPPQIQTFCPVCRHQDGGSDDPAETSKRERDRSEDAEPN